jgi:hypothetical protein
MIDTKLFENIRINKDFIETIFQFDVRKLETTDGVEISQYCTALGQYLIYLKYQMNKTKVELSVKKRVLDGVISQRLTPDLIKKFGTKTNAVSDIMKNSKSIEDLQKDMEPLQDELTLLDGLDRTISELIAVFKRELTRRDNELYTTRQERRSK